MSEKTVVVALGHRTWHHTSRAKNSYKTRSEGNRRSGRGGNPRGDLPQQRSAGRDDPHRNE